MSCQCYANAPDHRNGCSGPLDCRTLKSLTLPAAEKGLAYQAELRAALTKRDGVRGDGDLLGKMQRLGVPASVLVCLNRLEPRPALDAAKVWWHGDKSTAPGLVLVGAPGTGKSVAAAWVVLQAARAWDWNGQPTGGDLAPFVWLEGTRLSALSVLGDREAGELDAAARTRLLVLDDAGREGNRPALEALSDVMTERLDKRRPTALTTNLTGQPFLARYGTALADRFRTSAVVVNLARSESLRKPQPDHSRRTR